MPAPSWSSVRDAALTVMASFGPIVALAFGLVLFERLAPMAAPIIVRVAAFFGIRTRSAGSGAVSTAHVRSNRDGR